MKNNKLLLISFSLLIIFCLPNLAKADAGNLDLTFNGNGFNSNAFGSFFSTAVGVEELPNGKIIVGGRAHNALLTPNYDFAVARFNSDGTIDTTFGSSGIVRTDFLGSNDFANSMAVQPDGKIVLCGDTGINNTAGARDVALARYNSDGTLDTTFDTDGKVITSIVTNSSDTCSSLSIQSDGKIIAGGVAFITNGFVNLVRYNADGSLDTTFGTNGIVIGTTAGQSISSVAIQSDGKILATSFGSSFRILRFNSNGTLDTSFGTSGLVNISVVTGQSEPYAIKRQTDGKYVVGGYARRTSDNVRFFVAVRLTQLGTLDTTFDGDGIALFSMGTVNSIARTLAIQSNGKILLAGYTVTSNAEDFTMVRFNPDGSIDTTFGTNGSVISSMSTGVDFGFTDIIYGIFIKPNGKILVSGSSACSGNLTEVCRFTVAQYLGDGKRRADFDGDSRTDVSVFRPSNSAWYLQRSTQGFTSATFGLSSDTLIPYDYDGDNKADVAVFRPSSVAGTSDFYVLRSSNNTLQGAEWGTVGDVSVPGDYDGDGKDDYGVWRGSTGDFFVLLQTGTTRHYRFGINGDKPVVSDYDGDGKVDYAVFRPSNGTWYYARSIDNVVVSSQWGIATDKLVPADYDGDNKTDLAVWRPSDGFWYIQKSSGGNSFIPFGTNGDVPVPGEYDGDGKTDQAVYRNGNWYALRSTNGFLAIPFGLSSDVPTPSAFVY